MLTSLSQNDPQMVRRRTITQETGTSSLVETNETQVFNNPHSRSLGNAFHVLGKLALDLQTNLDNLKRICENLDWSH